MKEFSLLATRITAIFALLAVALWGYNKISELAYERSQKEALLATPKTWNTLTLHFLEDTQASLVTKWQDGIVSYQFELAGYPAAFMQANEHKNGEQPKFILTFLDKNGFKIFDQEILFSELKQLVNDSGAPVGLSAKGGTYKSSSRYENATSWDVVWAP